MWVTPSGGFMQHLPSTVKLSVTMLVVALLVTEYWYTPGSLPVTVSVLR